MDTKKPITHIRKACLVKWEINSKMKSTNVNHLKFSLESQSLEFPRYRWKAIDNMIEVKEMFITKIICILVDKWVISGAVNSSTKKWRAAPLSSLLNAIIQPRSKMRKFLSQGKCCSAVYCFFTLKFFSSYLRNVGKATSDAYFHL